MRGPGCRIQEDAGDGEEPGLVRALRGGPHLGEQQQGGQQMYRGPEQQGVRRQGEGRGVAGGPRPGPGAGRGLPEADRAGQWELPQQPAYPRHQGVGGGQGQWQGLCLREPRQAEQEAHVPRVQVRGTCQGYS